MVILKWYNPTALASLPSMTSEHGTFTSLIGPCIYSLWLLRVSSLYLSSDLSCQDFSGWLSLDWYQGVLSHSLFASVPMTPLLTLTNPLLYDWDTQLPNMDDPSSYSHFPETWRELQIAFWPYVFLMYITLMSWIWGWIFSLPISLWDGISA